jgi:periplasmic protein TonB
MPSAALVRASDSRDIASSFERIGLMASVIAHVLIAALALFWSAQIGQLPETPIYSVTLEGGKSLGGRAQTATDEKKSPVAPPKNVSNPSKAEPKAEEKAKEAVPPPKEEKKKEPEPEPKNSVPIKEPKPEPVKKAEPPKKESPKEQPKKEPAQKEQPVDLSKEYQKAMQRYLGDSTNAGGQGFGAAKIGGNAMGGGIVRPREFFIYFDILQGKLKEGWTWYDRSSVVVASVRITLAQDGTVTTSQITKSSGNPLFDESVLRAVRDASPVPPPPASVYQYFREVDIVFDPRQQ